MRSRERVGGSGGVPRSAGEARGGAPDGGQPLRVRGDEPPGLVTVAQLVGRERSRLGLAIVVRGLAAAVALAALVVAASAVALGDARWITRPGAPLAAWGVAVVAAVLVL